MEGQSTIPPTIISKKNTHPAPIQKVVLVAVPGAFTPGCHVTHVPPYVAKAKELKAAGADVIAFIAANDPFVMSAWGRVVGAKDEVRHISYHPLSINP